MMRFADNIVYRISANYSKKYKMNITTNKTRILVCAKNSLIQTNIYLNSQLLTQVHEFKYLRSLMTSDGRNI